MKDKYKEQAQSIQSNNLQAQPAQMNQMNPMGQMNQMNMMNMGNPYAMQMNMMNMMYMNMGMPMMQNSYQQMMMMNMMQNMGLNVNTMNSNRSNMFVRRAKDNKRGNKKRPPNRRRIGQGTFNNNNRGYRRGGRDNFRGNRDQYQQEKGGQRVVKQTPQQQTKSRVRLDSDTFPSLPKRELNVNIEVAAPGTLSGK